MTILECRAPGCDQSAITTGFLSGWCSLSHYGYFPHKCEVEGCRIMVTFDDEPYCFAHSPDSGSSERGYSAWERAQASNRSRT